MGVFREAYLKDKLFQNSGLEISSNVKHQLVWCLPQININLWSQGKDRYSGSTTLLWMGDDESTNLIYDFSFYNLF